MKNESLALRYGLIAGLSFIIITLFLYILDYTYLAGYWTLVPLVLVLGIIVYAGLERRKELGGYMGFKQAVTSTFITFLIAAVLWTIFNYLLYNVIDPDLSENMKKLTIERYEDGMKEWGMPEKDIERSLSKMKEQEFYSFSQFMLGLGFWLIIGFIYSLIVAAIIKKKRPQEEPMEESLEPEKKE